MDPAQTQCQEVGDSPRNWNQRVGRRRHIWARKPTPAGSTARSGAAPTSSRDREGRGQHLDVGDDPALRPFHEEALR